MLNSSELKSKRQKIEALAKKIADCKEERAIFRRKHKAVIEQLEAIDAIIAKLEKELRSFNA